MKRNDLTLPRIADHQAGRRPGGARGAPQPEAFPGLAAYLWLKNGDCIKVESFDPDAPGAAGGVVIPWDQIDSWVPA